MTDCHKHTCWTLSTNESDQGRLHPTGDNLKTILGVGSPPETVSISLPGSVWLTWMKNLIFAAQAGA